jgi:hypothetical protein
MAGCYEQEIFITKNEKGRERTQEAQKQTQEAQRAGHEPIHFPLGKACLRL